MADAVVAARPAQRAEPQARRHVPIGSLAELVSTTGDALTAVLSGVRLVTDGHVGDGNLHHKPERTAPDA